MPPISTSNSLFLVIPNTIMRWTMSYADSISRKNRIEYLRGIKNVEAGMTLEKDNEFLKMWKEDEDDDDDEEIDSSANWETIGISGDNEAWTILDGPASRRQRPNQDLPPAKPKRKSQQDSKIQGVALPIHSKRSQDALLDNSGKKVPATPGELAAHEQQHHQKPSPLEIHGSRTVIPLQDYPSTNQPDSPKPIEEDQNPDNTELGCPPVEDLFKDLPHPVTPVFRAEDSKYAIKTIGDRDVLEAAAASSVRNPTTVLSHTNLTTSPSSSNTEQVPRQVPSPHSSANDNPPSYLLTELNNYNDTTSLAIIANLFTLILSHLKQEYSTTLILHRHLRPSLKLRSPTLTDSPQTQDLTREQRQLNLARIEEAKSHLKILSKRRKQVKILMNHVMDCTQKDAAFRANIENESLKQRAVDIEPKAAKRSARGDADRSLKDVDRFLEAWRVLG